MKHVILSGLARGKQSGEEVITPSTKMSEHKIVMLWKIAE